MATASTGRLMARGLGAAIISVGVSLGACAERPKSLEVPLAFRPEMVPPGQQGPVPASPGLRLSIAPIADDRAHKDKIGENTEVLGEPRPVFAAGRTPVDFLQEIVTQELTSAGYRPISGSAGANRVLMIQLNEFFTTESEWYNCRIRMTSEVRDQGGAVLWQGQSAGTSKRYGRSMSRENYQECFSDAALLAVGDLIANKEFQAALTVP